MKNTFLGLALLSSMVAMSTGCGPALNPFFTSSDLYEDPALEGRWTDGKETWELRHTADSRYLLLSCEPECKDGLPATLFRLNGQVYLDFQESKANLVSSAILPHGLLRIRLQGDQVEIAGLDDNGLKAGLEQRRLGLSYVTTEDKRLLITAPTAKLQQFLSKHSLDPQVWSETMTYKRVTEPESPSTSTSAGLGWLKNAEGLAVNP